MLARARSTVVIVFASLLPLLASAAEPEPQWKFRLDRQDMLVTCRAKENPPRCITHNLIIDNESNSILECQAEIHYAGVNNEGFPDSTKPAVLFPRESRTVISEFALPEVEIASHNVTCKPRGLDMSRLTRSCTRNLDTSKVNLVSAYPPTSRRAYETGPVLLEFSLTRKEGPPQDVSVAVSSLFPRLDQAAVDAIANARGSTDCDVGRFMFRLDFKLTN
jgi:TonB family protein